MTSTVGRTAAYAAVGTLSLTAVVLEPAPVVLFAIVAAVGALVTDGPVFELFAGPADREEGRLVRLAGFGLAATALSVLVFFTPLPVAALVAGVLVVAYGNFGAGVPRRFDAGPFLRAFGYVAAGTLATLVGLLIVAAVRWEASALLVGEASGIAGAFPRIAFLSTSGGLLGALLRSMLFDRDDPLVLVAVGLATWILAHLTGPVTGTSVWTAIAVTAVLGMLAYTLETASVPGMLTGVLLALLTIVLGGIGWFAMLVAFFGIGGIATKFRYDDKLDRGVAEDDGGARGSGNVLGNSAVALGSVLGYAAAAEGVIAAPAWLFALTFAGSLAAAMSDTLSSEIGGLFDEPRLITTLEVVEPGTDGGVTWQGELAGIAGATVVAAIALLVGEIANFDAAVLTGMSAGDQVVVAVAIVVAGFAGMTVDSILGATVEGSLLGNQSVNLSATLAGAIVAGGLAVLVAA